MQKLLLRDILSYFIYRLYYKGSLSFRTNHYNSVNLNKINIYMNKQIKTVLCFTEILKNINLEQAEELYMLDTPT